MKIKKLDQNGSHAVAVLIIISVVAVVGFVGWRVMGSNKDNSKSSTTNSSSNSSGQSSESYKPVTWEYDGNAWKANGQAPDCKEPFKFSNSPVDVSKASAVLYPGQTRGTHYKAHGGFRFDGVADNKVEIKIPIDSHLYEGSRYIEGGETQYLLVFQNSCGIMYRFDHLLTLTEKFKKIVDDTLPAAQKDDSRTTKFTKTETFKAGEIVASAVGFATTNNVSADFGVYDLRKRNSASSDPAYVNKHQNESSQTFYGVCWFDWLPDSNAATVKALPAADQKSGKTSDYCK